MDNQNKKIILIILGLITTVLSIACILIILSLAGFFTYKQPSEVNTSNSSNTTNNSVNSTTNNTTNSTSNTNNQPKADINKTFVGVHTVAVIPDNWTIREYTNASGMSGYVEAPNLTYSGLTGLEILDENNTVLFSLKGVDGIGGSGVCATVAQFKDTDESYIEDIKTQAVALGFSETQVIDLTTSTYIELDILGQRFRRVGNDLYVAKNFSTSFNSACGLEQQFIKLDELSFTIDDNGDKASISAYKYVLNADINSSTLKKLDEVLKSLEAKNIS